VRAAQVAENLVTVGPRGHMIAEAARKAGLESGRISEFETAEEAVSLLRKLLTKEYVVLVKGSHGVHMERIISALEVL